MFELYEGNPVHLKQGWLLLQLTAVPAILTVSTLVAFLVYRWNDKQKKTDRAVELMKILMTSEFYVRARLMSQQYLMEHLPGGRAAEFKDMTYEEIDFTLRSSSKQEDR